MHLLEVFPGQCAGVDFRPSCCTCADCTFDSIGGDVALFSVERSSLALNNTLLSNSRQRDDFRNWSPKSQMFLFSGMFVMSGDDSSLVLKVRPLPTAVVCNADRSGNVGGETWFYMTRP